MEIDEYYVGEWVQICYFNDPEVTDSKFYERVILIQYWQEFLEKHKLLDEE